MKIVNLFLTLLITLCSSQLMAQRWGDLKGKVDLSPAWVRIDILESNKTVKRIDLWAVNSTGNFCFRDFCGLAFKPTIMYGHSHHGELLTGSLGIGFACPIREGWNITPSVGYTMTYLSTKIDLPQFALTDIRETFRSGAPFIALEATFTFRPGWRISGLVQYSWSRTHTKLKGLLTDRSRSRGPNYGIQLEYDLNDCFSVLIGAGYNLSLSKEKHGLRGTGVKAGLAYWF